MWEENFKKFNQQDYFFTLLNSIYIEGLFSFSFLFLYNRLERNMYALSWASHGNLPVKLAVCSLQYDAHNYLWFECS